MLLTHKECKVKYVFLYSFGLLVNWPDSTFQETGGDFRIGVLGDKPYGQILDQIAQKKRLRGRRIVIQRFQSFSEYRPCHVLYVTETVSAEECTSVVTSLRSSSVLIVGETPGFAADGGTMNFYIDGQSVKFELNLTASKRQQLLVNARLSKIAKVVTETQD